MILIVVSPFEAFVVLIAVVTNRDKLYFSIAHTQRLAKNSVTLIAVSAFEIVVLVAGVASGFDVVIVFAVDAFADIALSAFGYGYVFLFVHFSALSFSS